MDYKTTYNTLSKVCKRIDKQKINAYLVGGISAAIQTNTDLYRQNGDLDLMVQDTDLEKLIEQLEDLGYTIADKRGINTRNVVDKEGIFHAADHELNADTKDNTMLGVGIFVYSRENGKVTLNSYAKNEKEGCVVGSRKIIPEELFDLMYSSEKVKYHGTKMMTASKEYTYLAKTKNNRPKDKQDAQVLAQYIGEEEKQKIDRIQLLEKRVQRYLDKYDETGRVISTEKVPELKDTIKEFIQDYVAMNSQLQPRELLDKMMQEENVKRIMEQRQDISAILNGLQILQIQESNELATKGYEIAHMYCYSDNFEQDFEEMLVGEKENILGGLKAMTYPPGRQDVELAETDNKSAIIKKEIE